MPDPRIRPVSVRDAAPIQAIYAHHVLHGSASFDTEPPDEEFWLRKIALLAGKGWPFLVAEDEDNVLGYAYAAQIRDRPGYAPCCEDSIYVREDRLAQGVGRCLLSALLVAARAAGFEQMVAVIGGGEPGSIALHSRLGFAEVGRLSNVGSKFGRYLDSVYMQRDLRREEC